MVEEFSPSCPREDIIVLEAARYGRMQVGKCITSKFGHIGCAVDALGLLDDICSGHKHCTIAVTDERLLEINMCDRELSRYLEVSYTCLEGKLHMEIYLLVLWNVLCFNILHSKHIMLLYNNHSEYGPLMKWCTYHAMQLFSQHFVWFLSQSCYSFL